MESLVIVGIGETARLAYNYFSKENKYIIKSFLVSGDYKSTNSFCSLPVNALENIEEIFPCNNHKVFVAIGANRLNRDRTTIYNSLIEKGYSFATYISPHITFIAEDVKVGQNCFILEANVLQSGVKIGDNVFLWSGNHIGHKTLIKDHCFISSHCVISGFVSIGFYSFLGVNCTIEDETSIGNDNFIGAGCLIRSDTDDNSVYQISPSLPSKVKAKRLFKV